VGEYISTRFRKQVTTMQHRETEGTRSDRIELRATPHEKALLMRAAAIEHLDMTSFVMRTAVPAAQEIVERTEHDTQQMQQATDDKSQNTGNDLIAFFRNSPLADVTVELERDKATSRTITF
jgi:uncharacterized protein (DUF1778 family)